MSPVTREATLELGLAAYLDGIDVNGKQALALVRIGTDLQAQVDTHGAVIRARVTSGFTHPLESVPRIGVEVYANTYADVWDAAAEVERRLLRRYFWAGGYLIDVAVNESVMAEQAHANLRYVTSVWRLALRRTASL